MAPLPVLRDASRVLRELQHATQAVQRGRLLADVHQIPPAATAEEALHLPENKSRRGAPLTPPCLSPCSLSYACGRCTCVHGRWKKQEEKEGDHLLPATKATYSTSHGNKKKKKNNGG
ncbi:hypothetical protein TraAM80_06734 [Trypanosoma rangeli]|uniref:Uncharacterized protein n=1 Tax=Trypanosoma rangeli TaxID=5698 RepID=A0A3R7N856_TRYRA|nr:uncharacterized protein TraAM80_06734 [Trypanosoma rangeli]RNF01930.1 hypothetical protein TraAM80_06734 [Trypanosoma rangeli]|eukprot:RNF01930.1 hypothetical protein TraAM80_06734 [Trypanosoma rangeli]